MSKKEHTIAGLRPKKERDIFSMDKFKATFEKKENG
jgi:hypothetical protein